MEQLHQMQCVACRKGEPTVTEAEIAEFHPQVPAWHIVNVDGINHLERIFTFPNFVEALNFAVVGYAIVGIFVMAWGTSAAMWKFGRIGERRHRRRYTHAHEHVHASGRRHSHEHLH